MIALVAWTLLAAGTTHPNAYIELQNLAVHRDRQPDPFVTFDAVNIGRADSAPFDIDVAIAGRGSHFVMSGGGALASGAGRSFTIPTEKLLPGRNEVLVTVHESSNGNGRDPWNKGQVYTKVPPGGLPDLKLEHARRVRPGVYAFTVRNVGHAASPAFRIAYEPDRRARLFVQPDPVPGLAPGASRAFVLDAIDESAAEPKKHRFDVAILVDPDHEVPEEDDDNNSADPGFGYKGPLGERF
jgi:CARDB protein